MCPNVEVRIKITSKGPKRVTGKDFEYYFCINYGINKFKNRKNNNISRNKTKK